MSHATMYRNYHNGHFDAEGAFVLRMNEFSDVNISVSDAGSYIRLAWYPDEHAFGPSFFAAMARTTRFFRSELG